MRRIFLLLAALVAFAATARAAAPQCALQDYADLNRWAGNQPTCSGKDGSCSYLEEEVAALFQPYAIASVGAYYPDAEKAVATGPRGPRARLFQLEAYDGGYQAKGFIDEADSGLGLRVHHKRSGDSLKVVVAFRGTDRPTNVPDLLSNLSWFTRWFRDADQYKRAIVRFEKIRAEAEAVPGITRIAYVTTGHSLGGGLARHVARAFPCTAAVVFDSSFVTNEFALTRTYPTQVVMVHETGDWFGLIASFGQWLDSVWTAATGRAGERFHRYGLELIKDTADQHRIEPFATNMARLQICCSHRQHWSAQQSTAAARLAAQCSSLVQNTEALADAKRFYCERVRRLRLGPGQQFPPGDVCDFTSPRRGEQCGGGMRRLMDAARK